MPDSQFNRPALLADKARIAAYLDMKNRYASALALCIYTLFLAGFGVHHLAADKPRLGLFLIITSFIPGTLLIRIIAHGDRRTHKAIISISSLVVLLILLISGGVEGTALLWCFPLSMIIFHTSGPTLGIAINAGVWLIAAVIFYGHLPFVEAYQYDAIDKSRFLFSYLAVCMLSAIHEHFQISLVNLINSSREKLHQASFTDEQTGLPNRRYMQERLDEIAHSPTKEPEHIGLLIIDIDKFRQINDTYGYHVGDAVIEEMAKQIRELLRKDDELARWGHNEFFILLCPKSAQHARYIAENIRTAVEGHHYSMLDGKHTLTVSIGACDTRATPTRIKRALSAIDQLVLQCKQRGRNCVGFVHH